MSCADWKPPRGCQGEDVQPWGRAEPPLPAGLSLLKVWGFGDVPECSRRGRAVARGLLCLSAGCRSRAQPHGDGQGAARCCLSAARGKEAEGVGGWGCCSRPPAADLFFVFFCLLRSTSRTYPPRRDGGELVEGEPVPGAVSSSRGRGQPSPGSAFCKDLLWRQHWWFSLRLVWFLALLPFPSAEPVSVSPVLQSPQVGSPLSFVEDF